MKRIVDKDTNGVFYQFNKPNTGVAEWIIHSPLSKKLKLKLCYQK